MCTVSVKVNEELLQNMRPDLDSIAAISLWVQEIVNQHIQQMELEDTETMSIEEARTLTHAAIRDEYHKKVNAEKIAQVAYWKEHPLPREEALRRLKLLREQRLALQNK